MNSIRVLYDGWPLCREPDSPAALHTLALLTYLPETIQPIVAFPEMPPIFPVPVQIHQEDTPVQARLQWEQQILPRLRQQLNADLLHLTTETASLFSGYHTLVSPTQAANFDPPHGVPRGGLITRLRGALAAGGTARAQAVLWPSDLPPRPGQEIISLPPIVHPAFTPNEPPGTLSLPVEIPETYVLYHGPEDSASMRRALEAWTWVAGPIGQEFPLVMVGLQVQSQINAKKLAVDLKIADTIQLLPPISTEFIPALYQRAAVVFHPAHVSAWGGAIRHGLACGRPVVAAETVWSSAMVGPAAILVEPGDTRRLGASVIGIIVKENLSTRLIEAAQERAQGWRDATWGEKLAGVYARFVNINKVN